MSSAEDWALKGQNAWPLKTDKTTCQIRSFLTSGKRPNGFVQENI
jgi:hypothetical protein